MSNRKKAESVVLTYISELDTSGANTKIMKAMFAGMDDTQFENWIVSLEKGQDYVPIVYENLRKSAINIDNNLRVADMLGHDFFEQIWVTDAVTGREYLSPKKYMVVDLPLRRQVQMLAKKISIPEDNRHVDELTDQPSGISKGSAMSLPESLVLYSQGLERSLEEMIKFRGGDADALNSMERSIRETGEANMDYLNQGQTRVKSTQTMSTFFKAMHLDNNF